MNIEFEATFPNISVKDMQSRLNEIGSKRIKKRTLYKRVVFNLPNRDVNEYIFARVRDEGNVVTMTIKEWDNSGIEGQKELELKVDDFDTAVELMNKLGCHEKAYQETYREVWQLGTVLITIDEWPWLEPFVEIEGPDENTVRNCAELLGFSYSEAIFTGVTNQYMKKYGLSQQEIDNKTPRITFAKNPFLRNHVE